LAYVPRDVAPSRQPALLGLNLTTWLVLTLCDGRDDVALEHAFAEAMADSVGPGTEPTALSAALSQLERLGVMRRTTRGETAE
jgi:hypothetical protein